MSAHVPLDEILADIPGVLADYRTLGCRYIAVPWLAEERRPGHPGYAQCLEEIRMIGEEAERQEMTLLYHNHDFEFVMVDGRYALDRMYDSIPAGLLQHGAGYLLGGRGRGRPGGLPGEIYVPRAGGAFEGLLYARPQAAHMYELIGADEEEGGKEEAVSNFVPWVRDARISADSGCRRKGGRSMGCGGAGQSSLGKTPLECAA